MLKVCLWGLGIGWHAWLICPWVKRVGTVVGGDIDDVGVTYKFRTSSRRRLCLLQLRANRETFTALPCQALGLHKRSLIGHGHRVLTDVVQNQHLLLVHALSTSRKRPPPPPQTESDYPFGLLGTAPTCSFAHLAVSCVALRSGSRGLRPHVGSGETTAAAAIDKYV